MKAFLLFVATVLIAIAILMPDHFRLGVQNAEFWISRAVSAIF